MTTPALPSEQIPTFSDQPFSETVALARAGELVPVKDWAYEFSNGRKFDDAVGASG